MIAFIAKNRATAMRELKANFPLVRVFSSGYVSFDGTRKDGFIASREDHFRGMELSGFVLLDEMNPEMVRIAEARLRKPFYWHAREDYMRRKQA